MILIVRQGEELELCELGTGRAVVVRGGLYQIEEVKSPIHGDSRKWFAATVGKRKVADSAGSWRLFASLRNSPIALVM